VSTPWVTAEDTLNGEVAAFDRAILGEGLDAILAAARCVATGTWCMRRYQQLIAPDQNDKEARYEPAYKVKYLHTYMDD
jgi:hypothetical protein